MDVRVDIKAFPPFDHFHLKSFHNYVALSGETEKTVQ